ncbi:MAG: polymer-forming cytoskeletal protein [Thermodesulfobacteriota bacterium]|nr:polymer-forming cytoskeletal protein [Thermodesulfobacteriota bacterium]
MDSRQKGLSIIDGGLSVEGTLMVKGTLVIKGEVKGAIDGESLVVAAGGRVRASVRVTEMTIGGEFEGEAAVVRDLVILGTGSCAGKVSCRTLRVEKGGRLNTEVACSGG